MLYYIILLFITVAFSQNHYIFLMFEVKLHKNAQKYCFGSRTQFKDTILLSFE